MRRQSCQLTSIRINPVFVFSNFFLSLCHRNLYLLLCTGSSCHLRIRIFTVRRTTAELSFSFHFILISNIFTWHTIGREQGTVKSKTASSPSSSQPFLSLARGRQHCLFPADPAGISLSGVLIASGYRRPPSGLPGRGVFVSQSRAVTATKPGFFLWLPLCQLLHVGYSPCDHITS